jgi:hypothetical protein
MLGTQVELELYQVSVDLGVDLVGLNEDLSWKPGVIKRK